MVQIYVATRNRQMKAYVGQTKLRLTDRIGYHLRQAKRGDTAPFTEALREDGEEAFSWEVVETSKPEEALDRERHWMQEMVNRGYELYNIHDVRHVR